MTNESKSVEMLETESDVMVVGEDGLKIREKKWIRKEVYPIVDNTLDESTINYIEFARQWRKWKA